jgi:hypothetical protein
VSARLRKSALIAAALMFGAGASPLRAGGLPDEYQVKAAFIYNFAKFVEWPTDSLGPKEAPLTVCLAGRDPFGAAWAGIEGRQVQGRALQVRRGVIPGETAGCHVLFVADSEERRVPAILAAVGSQPVLTISDAESFAESGGAVQMVVADGRLQFDASLTALQRSRLKASSQVLKLARTVIGMPRATRP